MMPWYGDSWLISVQNVINCQLRTDHGKQERKQTRWNVMTHENTICVCLWCNVYMRAKPFTSFEQLAIEQGGWADYLDHIIQISRNKLQIARSGIVYL